MFSLNEIIQYDNEGICKISEIVEKDFAGAKAKFYVLTPINKDSLTIFVPINNKKQTQKMRKILTPKEIYNLINDIKDDDLIWINDDNERKQTYKKIIHSGDRKNIIKLIRTLYLHKKEQIKNGKKLHMCDEEILKNATRLLHEEFSHVLNIEPEEVAPFISEHIKVKEKINV